MSRLSSCSFGFARSARLAAALAVAAGVAGCATVQQPSEAPEPVQDALSQPLRDLSVIQPMAPDDLARAAADPYHASADCAANARELAQLTRALGPDVDAVDHKGARSGLAGDLVADAALPFRGVVRWVSGAEKRDQAMASVVLGAMVRRGFLKGEASARGCAAAAS